MRPFTTFWTGLALLLAASTGLAADTETTTSTPSPPPELKATEFKLLRVEKHTNPPLVQEGRTIAPATTLTFGVFAFRYHHPKSLAFWGHEALKGNRFSPRFTQYRVKQENGWVPLNIGYCGTGPMTFMLQPGQDYEAVILLNVSGMSPGKLARVSMDSPEGTFWSESFMLQNP